jgi:hypothetical protein
MWPFAQDAEEPATTLDIWLTVAALLAIVAFGIWAISRAKRWREETRQETATPKEQLDHFQKMVDDGLLDAEEFARIKARMEAPHPPPHASQPPDTSIQEK